MPDLDCDVIILPLDSLRSMRPKEALRPCHMHCNSQGIATYLICITDLSGARVPVHQSG
jgi:hypothetical protein